MLRLRNKMVGRSGEKEDALDAFDRFAPKHALLLVTGAILISSVLYALAFWTSLVGCDAAFIVAAGQSIIEDGFLRVNPFSMFDGLSWMSQQWLSSVLYAGIHSVFGYDGLVGMYALLMMALTFSIAFVCHKMTGNIWASCAASLALLSVLAYFSAVSPRIFDYLALVWGFYLVMVYSGFRHGRVEEVKISTRIAVCLGLCFEVVLMANLHASMWFLVPLFVVAFIISELLARVLARKEKVQRAATPIPMLCAVVLLAFFLSVVNPYGLDGTFYFVDSMGSTIKLAYGIGEIHPVWDNLGVPRFPICMAACLLVAVMLCYTTSRGFAKQGSTKKELILCLFLDKDKRFSAIPLCCLLLFIAAFLMAVAAIRNVPLLLLTTTLVFAWFASVSFPALPRLALGAFIVTATIFTAFFFVAAPPADCRVASLDDQVGAWAEGKEGQTAYTEVNYGSILETHGLKIWRDANAEQWTKKVNGKIDIQQIDFDLRYGLIDDGDFLDEYGFDYIFTNEEDGWISEEAMKERGYEKEASFHDLGEGTIAVWGR